MQVYLNFKSFSKIMYLPYTHMQVRLVSETSFRKVCSLYITYIGHKCCVVLLLDEPKLTVK